MAFLYVIKIIFKNLGKLKNEKEILIENIFPRDEAAIMGIEN